MKDGGRELKVMGWGTERLKRKVWIRVECLSKV